MIAVLVFFVMVHEAGHYVAARWTGMKVTEFFFGFGPKLWSTVRGETEYGVKAVPAGGYVRITGMNPLEEVDPSDVGRTYREKKFWEKSVVVLAGVFLHFAMAYLIVLGLLVSFGVPTGSLLPTVDQVATDSPASLTGLEADDQIVSLDGVAISGWDQLVRMIHSRGGQEVAIVVDRAGERVTLTTRLGTRPDEASGTGYLGIYPTLERQDLGLVEATGMAGRQTLGMIGTAYEALFRLIQPSSLAQLGGAFFDGGESLPDELRPTSPVGIAQIGSQAQELGLERMLLLIAFVNVFLGVLNGLPVYPLDGGHFAVALYERVTHRQADVRKLAPVAAMVIILLLFIGLVGLFLDIVNPIDLG